MAKLRQNHTRGGKRPFAGLAFKVFIFLGALSLLFVFLFTGLSDTGFEMAVFNNETSGLKEDVLIPEGNNAEIVKHHHFVLGYNENLEQAEWVSYQLTKESLKIPNVERSNWFSEDKKVSTGSTKHRDYSGSGYSRGHLAPAGDMAFSKTAMEQSFFMSNMTPQISGFNGGIWLELEETVRDWAYKNEIIYVATGPIFGKVTKYIGKESKIGVPDAFYKIIVDVTGSEKKGIGFIIPHEITDKPLKEFALPIDRVEETLGLDFFNNLYSGKELETQIEAEIDLNRWSFSNKRYQTRINHWNNN